MCSEGKSYFALDIQLQEIKRRFEEKFPGISYRKLTYAKMLFLLQEVSPEVALQMVNDTRHAYWKERYPGFLEVVQTKYIR